jgi:uncharacterized protein YeaO (DUF488 family)
MIKIKRIYAPATKEDGFRVLVDRLWARGLTKDKAQVGLWLRDIAPSNELRKWYSHEPDKWNDFQKKYGEELKEKQDSLLKIKQLGKRGGDSNPPLFNKGRAIQ